MVRKSLLAMFAAALVVAGGATAFAAQTAENDAQAVNQATVTLAQAVAAAEQQAGGRASKAEFEHSKAHGWVYDVEVVSGAKVFDVKVDAQKGTVLASTLDTADHGDEHDERD
ncbi:MAG: PepSY domain-containing protein [Burkholderiaceae bacterium]